jgi:DNA-binding MarR family transcriptional regulator
MAEALNKWLKMKKSPEPKEEAMLNLRVASHFAENRAEKICSEYGITGAQYNVLRILRGVYPDGHPRCEIISRMIETSPDTTRLIDRLEKQELVERDKSGEDKRMSITRITKKGLKLLDEMQPVLAEDFAKFTNNLSVSECKELTRLCEKLYSDII